MTLCIKPVFVACSLIFVIVVDINCAYYQDFNSSLLSGSDYDDLFNISNSALSNTTVSEDHLLGFNDTVSGFNTGNYNCGGALTKSEGSFNASCNPANYACEWTICADMGKFILIRPFRYTLKDSENCDDEYLEICDGCQLSENGSTPEGIRSRYCGVGLTDKIVSSSGSITITFKANSKHLKQNLQKCDGEKVFTGRYYLLSYNPECGGKFTGESGAIISPGYPMPLSLSIIKNCEWELRVPIGKVISFTPTDFSFHNPRNCTYYHTNVKMIDGLYSPHPFIHIFNLTNQRQVSFNSSFNSVQFKFNLRQCFELPKFKLLWKAVNQGCNLTINASAGIIASPKFPPILYSGENCWWKVKVNPGNAIRFMFLDWKSEVSDHDLCEHFHLMVAKGWNETDNFLDQWCSNWDPPNIIETNTNTATVLLKTNSKGLIKIGFRLQFETVCTRDLKGFNGVVESINFPNFYPPNLNCTWTIEVGNNSQLVLNFSHVNIRSDVLLQDFVEIIEKQLYDAQAWNTIGKFVRNTWTGKTKPTEIVSSGHSVKILMTTFNQLEDIGNGFRLEWKLIACGAEIRGKENSIRSPGYPKMYPRNSDCKWRITTMFKTRIMLTVHGWDIENERNCSYDGIKIYAGSDDTSNLLANLCGEGESIVTLTSDFNSMFIHFYSDNTIASAGFYASFNTTDVINGSYCGGIFESPAGYIHSPNYPNFYKNFENCKWYITVSPNYKVKITFIDLEVENSYDRITIYDGHSDSNMSLETYSGNLDSVPVNITSTANLMMVRFQSDFSANRYKGFKAKYFQTCGAKLRAESGVITNPEYMSILNGASNCSWIIEATNPNTRIVLIFTSYSWPVVDPKCIFHRAEVYDGEKVNKSEMPLLHAGCCSRVPPPLLSSGNAMTLQIMNAETLKFQAVYFTIPEDCVYENTFSSDFVFLGNNVNGLLHDHESCINLEVSGSHKIYATFQQFQHQSVNNICNTSFIEIYSNNFTGVRIGNYCRTEIPLSHDKDMYWVVHLKTRNVSDDDVRMGNQTEIGSIYTDTYTKRMTENNANYQFDPRFHCFPFLFLQYLLLGVSLS